MWVLWILCLTGSIICAPVNKGLGSNGAETQLPSPWYTFRGTGSPELGNSSNQAPQHTSSGSVGYTNYGAQGHPRVTWYETPPVGPDGYVAGQYGALAVGPDGYVVGQYQAAPVKVNSAPGTNSEDNKPVFSDVSDLEASLLHKLSFTAIRKEEQSLPKPATSPQNLLVYLCHYFHTPATCLLHKAILILYSQLSIDLFGTQDLVFEPTDLSLTCRCCSASLLMNVNWVINAFLFKSLVFSRK
ncbi:uncharacterized protein LOC115781362 [Archocentrus centrarchus]|uniref:uncharacterized protein LOC115781362 n=1 Tax=Archocentrus centrarchus TaxID=63155 RepID=UPI0011EA50C5|nr:uncharacterized protein LOC115781362 [Archocentrus centrarchus]